MSTIGIEAYPLHWPANKPRTQTSRREASRFETTFARARDSVLNEVKLLRGSRVVISTNVSLRRDGLPLAGQRQPDDPGVAVYFLDRAGTQKCIACDRWKKVEDNLWSIAKAIDALRGIQRWGTGDMVDAAFSGFAALPAPKPSPNWSVVFGMPAHSTTEAVKARYRELAMRHHPDRGGSREEMEAVLRAFAEFERERGLRSGNSSTEGT